LILHISARISGWSELSRVYRADQPFNGTCWHGQFIALRHYWGYGLITAGANRHGLYLNLFLGRLQGHPPLVIPWSDVTVTNPRRMRSIYQAELRFQQCGGVAVRIRGSLLVRLRSVYPEL
jgi:hypothetical protein